MYIIKLTGKQAHVTKAYFYKGLLYLLKSEGNRITIKSQKNRGNFYKWARKRLAYCTRGRQQLSRTPLTFKNFSVSSSKLKDKNIALEHLLKTVLYS